jgi:hypothetical protein
MLAEELGLLSYRPSPPSEMPGATEHQVFVTRCEQDHLFYGNVWGVSSFARAAAGVWGWAAAVGILTIALWPAAALVALALHQGRPLLLLWLVPTLFAYSVASPVVIRGCLFLLLFAVSAVAAIWRGGGLVSNLLASAAPVLAYYFTANVKLETLAAIQRRLKHSEKLFVELRAKGIVILRPPQEK